MSKWTHNICGKCWSKKYLGDPIRLFAREEETCCFCGDKNTSGIYVREHPANTLCKGTDGIHKEEEVR